MIEEEVEIETETIRVYTKAIAVTGMYTIGGDLAQRLEVMKRDITIAESHSYPDQW